MEFVRPLGWSIEDARRKSHLVWEFHTVVGTRGAIDATVVKTACGAQTGGHGYAEGHNRAPCRHCYAAAFRLAERMNRASA